MNFERGNGDIKTTLRIGRAGKAFEMECLYALVGVRPVPEEAILTVTITVVSSDKDFISMLQEGDHEGIDKKVREIAWEQLEHNVYEDGNFDYLLDKNGKISSKLHVNKLIVFGNITGCKNGSPIGNPEYFPSELEEKDIIFKEELYRYPEDL